MQKEIHLKYGSEVTKYPFPEQSDSFNILEPNFEIQHATFIDSLDKLLPTDSISYKDVAVVISDKTRLCGYDRYLPWLLEALDKKNAKKENITFYIAYGTHPKQTEEESFTSYGDTYLKYRFVHHDCTDQMVFSNLGTTSRGTSIKIRKDILNSSLIITYGAISHHYFAGYGGGRKLLFPGLAAKDSIYYNHSLFLDFDKQILSPGCQAGKLEGNPVAEDLKEIDAKMPGKISIHGILDSKGQVCKFMFGNSYEDFLAACDEHNGYYSSGIDESFDLVVASAGGYPKDINFIQSHKSMHNASLFVKDNGTLILLAECRDGIGNDSFLPLFETCGWSKLFESLKLNYAGNGGTAIATLSKTSRISVKMVTSLSAKDCSLMGAEKVEHQQAREIISGYDGKSAFIANASMLIK